MKIIPRLSNIKLTVLTYILLVLCPIMATATEFMGIDEITIGMKGYGKTVFSGKKIETFDVEVLGIIRNWEAGSNMILVKMSGGPLERTGIIAGMSGSPVYINERLIGAVSHGWSFAMDAIAGVTPIGEMLNVFGKDDENVGKVTPAKNNTLSRFSGLHETVVKNGFTFQQIYNVDKLSKNTNIQQPYEVNLVPIQTPLIVSGIDNRSLRKMGPLFNKFGWVPFSSNSGGTNYAPIGPDEFVPGASVAVELIRGDLNASIIGTLTYVDGNDILAFGHPMMQVGKTDIPMSTSYVYTILVTQSNSVKLAVPEKVIGRITQDRRAAIAGEIGVYAKMIPCQVKIAGYLDLEYNFEIIHDINLTPNLLFMAVESVMLATEKSVGEKLINLKLDIELEERAKHVKVENFYYEAGASWFTISNVIFPVAILLNNEFKFAKIKSIKLDVEILDTKSIAFIENIRVNKKWVNPGDEVLLNIRLKPVSQDYVDVSAKIRIPDDVKPGSRVRVTVCDGNYNAMVERASAPGRFIPSNFEQLIDVIEEVENNKNIVIRIRTNKKGITYMGESFPSLPNSFLSIMSSSNQSGIARLREADIKRIKTEWFIAGKESINLFVEKK